MSNSKIKLDAFDRDVYFQQVLGLTCMMSWLSRWENLREWTKLSSPHIPLSQAQSQRFALGFPHSIRYGNVPFLTIQEPEEEFFSRIQWSRVCLDFSSSRLIFVSKKIVGNDDLLADIPAFAISVEFDELSKLKLLESYQELALRTIWFDDQGEPQVSAGPPLDSISIIILNDEKSLFKPSEIEQQRSLLEISILKQEELSLMTPQFLGKVPDVISGLEDFVAPFDESRVEKVRYEGYKEKTK